MKKITRLFNMTSACITMFAAMTALTVACSSDADEREVLSEAVPLTFTSQLEDLVDATRSATNLQGNKIASGVKAGIYVYDAQNAVTNATYATAYKKENISFTSDGNNGWSSAPTWYWPGTGNKINVYAYAPYNSGWKLSGTNSFSVGTTQTTDAQYLASDLLSGSVSNPVARGTGTPSPVAITFTHQLSKVTITLTAGTGVTLSDVSKVEILNTKVTGTVTMANNAISSVAPASGATASTIQCGGAGSGTSYACSGIVIPGQTISTSTILIRVTMSSGGTYDYKPKTAVTFTAGKEYRYAVTLNTYGLTVTSSVTDWGTQTTENGSTYNNQ